MRVLILALLTILVSSEAVGAPSPFFLPARRIHRLKLDRERQTPRWTNFENRVKNVTDSPERGLELALYYAITGDEARGKEAVRWDKAHPSCESPRQSLLIKNWVGEDLYSRDTSPKAEASCPNKPLPADSLPAMRDQLMADIAAGKEPNAGAAAKVVKALEEGAYRQGEDLYAAVEFLSLSTAATRVDARDAAPKFFTAMPLLLLLGLKPKEVERPDWQTHIGALALVSLDPNSNGAQFLQAWAIEDQQMLHEGPGVAYELLWADPYLPGVGYQNLDPWIYDDESGTLFARADWTPQACWIHLAPQTHESEGCPAGWERKTTHFGHLTLMPAAEKCIEFSVTGNEAAILFGLPPGQKLRYDDRKQKSQNAVAGPSGLWRAPGSFAGKACVSR